MVRAQIRSLSPIFVDWLVLLILKMLGKCKAVLWNMTGRLESVHLSRTMAQARSWLVVVRLCDSCNLHCEIFVFSFWIRIRHFMYSIVIDGLETEILVNFDIFMLRNSVVLVAHSYHTNVLIVPSTYMYKGQVCKCSIETLMSTCPLDPSIVELNFRVGGLVDQSILY